METTNYRLRRERTSDNLIQDGRLERIVAAETPNHLATFFSATTSDVNFLFGLAARALHRHDRKFRGFLHGPLRWHGSCFIHCPAVRDTWPATFAGKHINR